MFPAGRSSLQVFLSGLFAAMLSVWLYTILQIALASQMNTGLGFHGLLYPFLGGLVNPLIALFAGSMGFSSIMAASGVVSGAAVKIFSRGKA
jgi:Ni/Fe-hydrogenase subunit HybB-like protein